MDRYKEKMNDVHAPEALIEKTLDRIHAEEQKTQTMIRHRSSKTRKVVGISTMAGMAAAVALLVAVTGRDDMELNYNTISEGIIRGTTETTVENNLDVETYSDYLGINITEWVEDAVLIKSEICVSYENEQIVTDEGTFYYNVEGDQVMVKISKTGEVAPEDLLRGMSSEVDGQIVFAGVNETEKERLAAFEYGDVSCLIMSYNMDQTEFESFLEKLLEE